MEGSVGIRTFRDRLTRYVARVRRGGRVVVTDRGRPVAVLIPYKAADQTTRDEEALARVLASGHVTPAQQPLRTGFKPVRGKGKPASRIIIEDRR